MLHSAVKQVWLPGADQRPHSRPQTRSHPSNSPSTSSPPNRPCLFCSCMCQRNGFRDLYAGLNTVRTTFSRAWCTLSADDNSLSNHSFHSHYWIIVGCKQRFNQLFSMPKAPSIATRLACFWMVCILHQAECRSTQNGTETNKTERGKCSIGELGLNNNVSLLSLWHKPLQQPNSTDRTHRGWQQFVWGGVSVASFHPLDTSSRRQSGPLVWRRAHRQVLGDHGSSLHYQVSTIVQQHPANVIPLDPVLCSCCHKPNTGKSVLASITKKWTNITRRLTKCRKCSTTHSTKDTTTT